jgi:lipopolysaccharide export system permease protein
MLTSIDRYIFRRELAAFAAVLLLVTAILALENVPRICDAVSRTSVPLWLLGRMLVALLPEYLAIGILVASFIAPAWTIRTMALRGEWQILPSTGLAPWRAMLAPLLVAVLATGGQLTLRLVLEPYGERLFDELGTGLDGGAFGLPIGLHEFVELDSKATILLTPPTKAGRSFGHVFLRYGPNIYSAASANAHRDASGRIEVDLFDGRQIGNDGEGRGRVMDFETFRFAFSPSARADQILPSSERLSRLPLTSLLGGAVRENSTVDQPRPMTASLVARISNALFCLLLPWLAYVLAQPPRRERSGAGIAVGVGALVLFLRTNSAVETHFTHWPISAALFHLALWSCATLALVRFGMAHDDGAIDHALNDAWASLVRSWRQLRHRPLLPQATQRAPWAKPA